MEGEQVFIGFSAWMSMELIPVVERLMRQLETIAYRDNREFLKSLEAFEAEMDTTGPFFMGETLGWVDILIAPCQFSINPCSKTILMAVLYFYCHSPSNFDHYRGHPARACLKALSKVLSCVLGRFLD